LWKGIISKFRSEIKRLTGVKIWENEARDLISDCLK
jgi:hypothetical protein